MTAQFVSGVLFGSSGCNQYNVGYKLKGNKMTIKGPVAVHEGDVRRAVRD